LLAAYLDMSRRTSFVLFSRDSARLRMSRSLPGKDVDLSSSFNGMRLKWPSTKCKATLSVTPVSASVGAAAKTILDLPVRLIVLHLLLLYTHQWACHHIILLANSATVSTHPWCFHILLVYFIHGHDLNMTPCGMTNSLCANIWREHAVMNTDNTSIIISFWREKFLLSPPQSFTYPFHLTMCCYNTIIWLLHCSFVTQASC